MKTGMTGEEITNLGFEKLLSLGAFDCACGRHHTQGVHRVTVDYGAIRALPEYLTAIGSKKPFLLSGHDTFAAAGKAVTDVLDAAGIGYAKYVFPVSPVHPTEETVGRAVVHFDYTCDAVVGIGSGVVNDTGKILARATGREYIIVAAAPSMDGFVSATSSMDIDSLKVSLPSKAPWGVIGDLDILRAAPMELLQAGVGDMLAKLTSLAEWKLAQIIVDEYYCPTVAALTDRAVHDVIDKAPNLLRRDGEAARSVMQGLIIAGAAMNYAGLSRPASGTEHYFSHIWDMRALCFDDAKSALHGTQAGIGTLYTLRGFEAFRKLVGKPGREKALAYVRSFSPEDWNERLRDFIGAGAEAMIEGERRERKYDLTKHEKRLARIEEKWDEICAVIDTLPSSESVEKLMASLGMPTSAECIGYDSASLRNCFIMSKDIRDKYVSARLYWDLGVLDEVADAVFG